MGIRCGCGISCALPIIIGIIAGIITSIFHVSPIFIWIAFGISLLVLFLFLGLIFIATRERKDDIIDCCICRHGTCLLIGIFGTLITSIMAISSCIIGWILKFLVAGFFFWMIVALFILLVFIVLEHCNR